MKRRSRGYTAVELLMSIGVLGLGVCGVIAMQKVVVASNGEAKNLALATRIAESWLDELAADAGQWNDTGDFDETAWLTKVGAEGSPSAAWFRPDYVSGRNFGSAFDALGNPVATADIATKAQFCSDLRLRWMNGQANVKKGAGLIRAEVRVFWRREGVVGLSGAPPKHVCDIDPAAFDGADGQKLYHVIYLSTALREQLGAPE
ncbi:MAG TPA: type II secretion system protein [Polyangiaceae bacterium]|jgi:type II secretory pathway pseudopilin PulG|nr:type II secretion system protein [Polyangiaceae bacterium]